MTLRRLPRESVAAAGLVALDALARLVIGDPYPGATFLMLAACGVSFLPLLPRELASPSLRLALLPALALASFTLLLTTVSFIGISLTELSVRLAVILLVAALAITAAALRDREDARPATPWSWRQEAIGIAVLAGIFVFSVASSWDIAGSYPPRGTDWGHYLLYADEVEAQDRLLIDDPLAGEDDRVFADPVTVGTLYGGFRILDGISSRPLASGVVVVSGLTVLSMYVAVAALWGVGGGLLAAAAYAVSPIRLEPMYWHGLATTLALVFLPLVVLALGLMYRGRRDWRASWLLALSLIGLAAAHSTTAVVAAVLVLVALVLDAFRWFVVRTSRHSWWTMGLARPVLVGLGLAALAGAGVVGHLRAQAADLGSPVSYRFFEPDWFARGVFVEYYSLAFLVVAATSAAVVLLSARLRSDPALLAVVSLATASIVVGQLWRLEVPFEYRRAVYSFGLALVIVIGVACVRLGFRPLTIAGYLVVLAYIAHVSTGFRLPERLLTGSNETSPAVTELTEFRNELDRRGVPDSSVVVADRCLHFVVPYLLRRPTLAAFEEWQVGFENRVPLARRAATVLEGGDKGRQLARSLGVRYVVVDPQCSPDVEARLGGTTVVRNDAVVIVELPARG